MSAESKTKPMPRVKYMLGNFENRDAALQEVERYHDAEVVTLIDVEDNFAQSYAVFVYDE